MKMFIKTNLFETIFRVHAFIYSEKLCIVASLIRRPSRLCNIIEKSFGRAKKKRNLRYNNTGKNKFSGIQDILPK